MNLSFIRIMNCNKLVTPNKWINGWVMFCFSRSAFSNHAFKVLFAASGEQDLWEQCSVETCAALVFGHQVASLNLLCFRPVSALELYC